MRFSGVIFAGIVFISLFAWGGNFYLGWGADSTDRGTFGDMFGVVNSLFSGLAFIGVVYSIILQMRELQIARQDSDRAKSLVEKQSAQLEEQTKQMELQRDEQLTRSREVTLFHMFDTFSRIVDGINFSVPQHATATGRSALKSYAKLFLDKLNGAVGSGFDESYLSIYNQHKGNLAHYFRTIYTILQFIDAMPSDARYFYAKMFRSQFSDDEILLLLFSYLHQRTSPKFKELVDKYGILKNARESYQKMSAVQLQTAGRVKPAAFGKQYAASCPE